MMNTEAIPLVYPPWIKDSSDVKVYFQEYLNVRNKSKPVMNVAFGMEKDLSKSFYLFFGFRTDFSGLKKSGDANIYLHNAGEWHLYNVSAGLSYHTPKQTITPGLNYMFSGKKSIDPYAVINPFSPSDFHSTVSAHSCGIVLGYTHYLKK